MVDPTFPACLGLVDYLSKNKVYVVETAPGTYRRFFNWPECQAFVHGKPYAFAGGVNESQAKAKLIQSKKMRNKASPATKTPKPKKPVAHDIPTTGICSDAGTHGNPGPTEYQVTDLTGKLLGHRHLGIHTNNYAELAGIEAMISYAIEHGETKLYTDSKVAMIWIEKGRLGPTVHEADLLLAMIGRIRHLLANNPKLALLKWHTRRWGEIPADFGRK